MRILYLHRTQGEEPESIHIREIIEALQALGHEVKAVGPAKLQKSGTLAQASRLGRIKKMMPRFLFELMQIAYNVIAFREVNNAIAQFRPDFIYERYALFGFAGVWAARRAGIPLVLEVNTPYAFAWARYYGLTLKKFARSIEKKVLEAADGIITVTDVQKRFLHAAYVPRKPIVVCQNAIDPLKFFPAYPCDTSINKRLNKPANGLVVGFVGTMNRWQGIPGFKEVIPRVLQNNSDLRFLFVGDGEYRKELEDFVQASGFGGAVVFAGRRMHSDIPSLVSAMDITVLLNSNDYGSPMKIFEYWAMGKAVIAPRVAPVEEVMRHGENGIIIDRGDSQALVDSILELACDASKRQRLGRAGRDYVLSHHTWKRNAQAIVDEYARILAQNVTSK
ncbi:MAG: glycosyltransferase family 4 protein [Pseudomonadota bacterium]